MRSPLMLATYLCLAYEMLAGEPVAIWTVKDHLDHRWVDEIVHFDFDVPAGAGGLRLTHAEGGPLLCQLSDVVQSEDGTRISGRV